MYGQERNPTSTKNARREANQVKTNRQDLDDDCMGRQVHSPGQCGSADQHLEVAFGEHALHHTAVRTQHASMMDPKAFWEHLLHLLVSGALDLKEMDREVSFGQKRENCLRELG